jgi:hypothetical protein
MTTRKTRIRPKIGDLFGLPLAQNARAYGQVIAGLKDAFLVAIFKATDRATEPSFDDAIRSGIDLVGYVLDTKLANGDWPIYENRPPVAEPNLWFVTGSPDMGNLRLMNLDGTVTRRATPQEASLHRRLNLSSPMVLQMAASASRGFLPWRSDFDHFRHYASELVSNTQRPA